VKERITYATKKKKTAARCFRMLGHLMTLNQLQRLLNNECCGGTITFELGNKLSWPI